MQEIQDSYRFLKKIQDIQDSSRNSQDSYRLFKISEISVRDDFLGNFSVQTSEHVLCPLSKMLQQIQATQQEFQKIANIQRKM